ncbi:MAG: DNA sulfur modification protein DndD [Halobacteriota archaeon]
MIITKLVVQNIGLFKGAHTFDLRPSATNGTISPIILIGGKNGAGKTTLFQAIRLCLYGNNTGVFKRRKQDYDHYIAGIFHRISGSSMQLDCAAVAIEFEHAHLGQQDVYEVQRSWKRQGASIDESLKVTKNGKEILDLDPSQWQEFINELIPPGISQLFFFDGEKIKRLADHDDDDAQLKESFRVLLGLNLVEQLRSDLQIYCTREMRALQETENTRRNKELEDKEMVIREQLEQEHQAIAQKRAVHSQIAGQIERFEAKIAQEGGSFAKQRMQRKFEMEQLDRDIETERNNIKELASNLLPFALTPKYCSRVKERLLKEAQYIQYQNAKGLYDKLISDLNERLNTTSFWADLAITRELQRELQQKLKEAMEEQGKSFDSFYDYTPVHELSLRDQQSVMTWIHQALRDIPDLLSAYTKRLEECTRQRRHAESLYNRAPDDDVLSPMMQEFKELNHELGQLEEHIRSDAEQIRRHETELAECRKALDVLAKRRSAADTQSHRVKIAGDVQNVLDDYVTELQEVKSKELSSLLFECFTRLSRKGSTVEHIEISPSDFNIAIYERGGNVTSKKELSIGEKQIYAISMLWALTKASKRPLPFVIDTPLGRLDSDHRRNLVTDFFPNASHQMIIFSTDTEINEAYFSQLKDYISRSYHLHFNIEDGSTTVDEGYFWDSVEEGC